MHAHVLTHTPAIQGCVTPSAHFTPRWDAPSGSHYHGQSLPKSPTSTTHSQSFTDTPRQPLTDRHLESPITATHHGLPRGHPLPQPRTRWYARTHESQSQSHTTDSLTRTQSKQSWSHIWIPAHTQNTHPSTQITEHLQKRRAPPPPPGTLSPHTPTLGSGK